MIHKGGYLEDIYVYYSLKNLIGPSTTACELFDLDLGDSNLAEDDHSVVGCEAVPARDED